jgi:hypothetical protein
MTYEQPSHFRPDQIGALGALHSGCYGPYEIGNLVWAKIYKADASGLPEPLSKRIPGRTQNDPVLRSLEISSKSFEKSLKIATVVRKKSIWPYAATSSSQYSWCSPPRTSLLLIRHAAGSSCRRILGDRRECSGEFGIPGPKLECGRPLL